MTIDEAIKHCEEIAMDKTNLAQTLWDSKEKARCEECAEEHNQLAQWLIELKMLKTEQQSSGSENPNNCDLISRGEVLENAFKIYTHECGLLEVVGVATIKTLPSVKPQEKTGHWIIMGDRYIKCSECGHITKTESPDIYHFCMVCGANMSEIPTGSKPEISSYYGLKSYVRERSE